MRSAVSQSLCAIFNFLPMQELLYSEYPSRNIVYVPSVCSTSAFSKLCMNIDFFNQSCRTSMQTIALEYQSMFYLVSSYHNGGNIYLFLRYPWLIEFVDIQLMFCYWLGMPLIMSYYLWLVYLTNLPNKQLLQMTSSSHRSFALPEDSFLNLYPDVLQFSKNSE